MEYNDHGERIERRYFTEQTRRRLLRTLGVAGAATLAGCMGDDTEAPGTDDDSDDDADDEEDEPTETQDDDDEPEATDEEEVADGETDADDIATWEPFAFDQPARYTYEIFVADEGDGTLVWEVEEIENDTVTVHMEFELGDQAHAMTTTGDRNTVQAQVMGTPAGGLLTFAMFTPMAWYRGRELSVGTQWTQETDEGTASFEITGKESHAGVECYHSEMTLDDELFHESCVSPDLGLAVYTAWYEPGVGLEFEMELVDYERT